MSVKFQIDKYKCKFFPFHLQHVDFIDYQNRSLVNGEIMSQFWLKFCSNLE